MELSSSLRREGGQGAETVNNGIDYSMRATSRCKHKVFRCFGSIKIKCTWYQFFFWLCSQPNNRVCTLLTCSKLSWKPGRHIGRKRLRTRGKKKKRKRKGKHRMKELGNRHKRTGEIRNVIRRISSLRFREIRQTCSNSRCLSPTGVHRIESNPFILVYFSPFFC